ncbi:hypothetical protein E4T39_08719 [Aureobasidium subglaciale]|nr:hypothetical protein E4T39_08719 [Aureobasidium subglaciale]
MFGRGFDGSQRNGASGGIGQNSGLGGLGGGLGGALGGFFERSRSSHSQYELSGGITASNNQDPYSSARLRDRGEESRGSLFGGLGGGRGSSPLNELSGGRGGASLGGLGGGRGGSSLSGLGGGRGGAGGIGSGLNSVAGGPQKLIGTAVQGVASGIGLVSERVKGRKNSQHGGKSSSAPHSVEEAQELEQGSDSYRQPPGYHEAPIHIRDGEALEMEWALDEAQDAVTQDRSRPTDQRQNVDQITDFFLANNMRLPEAVQAMPLRALPFPVLLPQRRPKDRSRGFIRAYSPVLLQCGIDQNQWLDFLDAFEKSSQASPWIQALNLASFATIALPSITSFAVSAAIQVATIVAAEGQTRYKTNTFLDRVNRNFFEPRGLFCLVMTWNPDSGDTNETFNMASNVVKSQDSRNKFKGSSGKSFGEGMFSEVAPLVFPHLDTLQDEDTPQANGVKAKLKSEKLFLEDYWDRRATAKYAKAHPDSVLAKSVPKSSFASRYSDPSHAASSGDLISLITGGHLSSGGGLQGIVAKATNHGQTDSTSTQGGAQGQSSAPSRGLDIKKFMGKNVLYLLVVNMPTDQELADARSNLQR